MADLTVAERHNNPLNMKVGPATIKWIQSGDAEVGEPAADGGRFLKFTTPDKGLAAAQDLLFNQSYAGMPYEAAMRRWSGGGYGADVNTSIPADTLIKDFTPEQRQTLVGSMAKREGYGGSFDPNVTPSQPAVTPQKPAPFNEIAKSFDPMMPQQIYDNIRDHYFYNVVAPQIAGDRDTNLDAARKRFYSQTERPPMLTPAGRALAQVGVGATSLAKELVAPLTGVGNPLMTPMAKWAYDQLDQKEQQASAVMIREGMDPSAAKTIGSFLGSAPEIAASYTATGPAAAALTIDRAVEASAAIKFAYRTLHGGMAMSTWEAAREQNGNRVIAGLKGFGYGAAFDAGLGMLSLPGWLKASGTTVEGTEAQVAKDMMNGKAVPPPVDQQAAEYVKNQVEVARREARPDFINADTSSRGVRVMMKDKTGKDLAPLSVIFGNERDAVHQVNALIDKGASLNGIDYHPLDQTTFVSFIREIRQSSAGKYENIKNVQVADGTAEQVARQAQRQGLPVAAVAPDTVQVSGVTNITQPDGLPKGVTYIGQQTVGEGKSLPMYNVELPDGSKDTFMVGEGQTIEGKANALLAKHTAALQTQQLAKTIEGVDVEQAVQNFAKGVPGGLNEQALGFVRGQIQRVWDTTVADADKQNALNFLRTNMPELLPERYRADQVHVGVTATPESVTPVEALRAKLPDQRIPTIEELQREYGMGYQRARDALAAYTNAIPPVSGDVADVMADEIARGKPDNAGAIEERVRKGEIKARIMESMPLSERQPAPNPEARISALLAQKEATGKTPAGLAPAVPGAQLFSGPSYNAMVVEPGQLQRVFNSAEGVGGIQFVDTQDFFNKVGQEVPRGFESVLKVPTLVLDRSTTRDNIWHEQTHAHITNLNYDMIQDTRLGLMKHPEWENTVKSFGSAMEVAQGLKKYVAETYGNKSAGDLLNEAFVYGAQAVRFGDTDLLKVFGDMDGGQAGVIEYVNMFSKLMSEHAEAKIDSVPMRVAKRRMDDLVRRSSYNVSSELRRAFPDQDVFWDGERWNITGADGKSSSGFKDLNAVWDQAAKNDESHDMFPGISFGAEIKGVRGPFTDGGPPRNPPLPNAPIDADWKGSGIKSFLNLFRPLLPATASTHEYINSVLQARGQYFPLWERVKAVDESLAKTDKWVMGWKERLAADLPQGNDPKHYDMFNALKWTKFAPARTIEEGKVIFPAQPFDESVLQKYQLNEAQGKQLERFATSLRDFQEDTKIPVFEYLNTIYPRLRSGAWEPDAMWPTASTPQQAGFWENAVRYGEGNFDPSDQHLGRFTDWLLRQGMEKKFTGPPVRDLEKLINLKDPQGRYVMGAMRYPFANYARYVRQIPDTSQQILNSAVGTLSDNLATQFKRLNQYLPAGAQLPEEFSAPQTLLNKWMVASYAAGIGLRPALVVRDAMAAFITALPVLGPTKFLAGMAKGLTGDGMARASEAGALLNKSNIGEAYGDIFRELPAGTNKSLLVKASNFMLAPARWGNNLARSLTYNAVYDEALEAIRGYRAGEISVDQFMRDSSLWATHDPRISQLVGEATQRSMNTVPEAADALRARFQAGEINQRQYFQMQKQLPKVANYAFSHEDMAKKIALELVDITGFPMRRGTQPAVLRTGMGRLFGQYGNWPLNYIDFIGRMTGKMAHETYGNEARKAAATWVAANYAIGQVMNKGLGAEASNWIWTSPMAYTGGPQMELVRNIMQGWEDSDAGREARRRVLEYPLNFAPGYIEMQTIGKALDEPDQSKQLLMILGFKPTDEVKDLAEENLTLPERIKWQAGFGRKRD